MHYADIIDSPIGDLCVCSDGENLSGLWMMGQQYFQATGKNEDLVQISTCGEHQTGKDLSIFREVRQWLSIYFSGSDPGELPPIKAEGGEFRQLVWRHLREIPYGQLTTYGEIARKVAVEMGKTKMSAQAVGNAVGHNPISIIVPCHRVVGSDRSLTGYASGLGNKRFLLALEGVDVSSLKIPVKGTAL